MDWSKTLIEIQERGYTQSYIAEMCDCSQSYVSSLISGVRKSPSWDIGERIRRLHKKCMKKAA